MDSYEIRHMDIQDWEVVSIGDEFYRLLAASGYSRNAAKLTTEDLDRLLDVYHYWKILLECNPRFTDMGYVMYSLHFDVIIELFLHRKLGKQQRLQWIFD